MTYNFNEINKATKEFIDWLTTVNLHIEESTQIDKEAKYWMWRDEIKKEDRGIKKSNLEKWK